MRTQGENILRSKRRNFSAFAGGTCAARDCRELAAYKAPPENNTNMQRIKKLHYRLGVEDNSLTLNIDYMLNKCSRKISRSKNEAQNVPCPVPIRRIEKYTDFEDKLEASKEY